jgi:acetylglutamate kinase
MQPPDTILRFLWGTGLRTEAEFYLSLFRAEAKERFATISVDAPVVAHGLEALAMDLRYLVALGLVPVVTTGLFADDRGEADAAAITQRLARDGVAVRHLDFESVFGGGRADSDLIREAVSEGALPVLSLATAAQSTEAERFERAGALVAGLRSRKLIFLQRRGGIAIDGHPVGLVNLEADIPRVVNSPDVSSKQRAILNAASAILRRSPRRCTISITSPIDLLRELFTVRGAGTLIRRAGVIQKLASFDELDLLRLRVLLDTSFGRPVGQAFFSKPISAIFLEENYRGVAVVVDTDLGAYMSKFAVDTEAQGEGIGKDVWNALLAERPSVFWRSRPQNPINGWYAKECHGMVKRPEWQIFWRDVDASRIADVIAYCEAQGRDFPG